MYLSDKISDRILRPESSEPDHGESGTDLRPSGVDHLRDGLVALAMHPACAGPKPPLVLRHRLIAGHSLK